MGGGSGSALPSDEIPPTKILLFFPLDSLASIFLYLEDTGVS